jgi:hypothetical protein
VLCRPSPEFPFRFIWVLGWSTWHLALDPSSVMYLQHKLCSYLDALQHIPPPQPVPRQLAPATPVHPAHSATKFDIDLAVMRSRPCCSGAEAPLWQRWAWPQCRSYSAICTQACQVSFEFQNRGFQVPLRIFIPPAIPKTTKCVPGVMSRYVWGRGLTFREQSNGLPNSFQSEVEPYAPDTGDQLA